MTPRISGDSKRWASALVMRRRFKLNPRASALIEIGMFKYEVVKLWT
jgi:hypothetical protein